MGDCGVRGEIVQGFRDEDVQVAVGGFFGRRVRDLGSLDEGGEEGEDGLGQGVVLRGRHAGGGEAVGLEVEGAAAHR